MLKSIEVVDETGYHVPFNGRWHLRTQSTLTFTMPYSKVQFFSVQTQGFMEMFPDSELSLSFTNGFTATFEFKGNVDIAGIGRMISEYVL